MVEVHINGTYYDFIFDSGAERTVIRQEIPLEGINMDTTEIIDVFSERYAASAVALDTLYVGQLKVSGLPWVVQTEMMEDGEDGILGGDVLRNVAWKIDFARRRIYAAKKASHLQHANDGESIYFKLSRNLPYLTYRMNGLDIETIMDTGDNGCLSVNCTLMTDPMTVNKIKAPLIYWYMVPVKVNTFEAYIDVPRLYSTIDTFSYIDARIEIGGYVLPYEVVQFVPQTQSTAFGLDFLQRFEEVVLDYPGRKLFLGKPRHKSFLYLATLAARLNSMGVELSRDSIPTVTGISSFVAAKDIRLKDTIIAIGGVSFLNQPNAFYTDSSFRRGESQLVLVPAEHTRVLEQFAYRNDTATLHVKRGGRVHQVTLTRGNTFTYLPDTVMHIQDSTPSFGYIVETGREINDERGRYYLLNTRKRPFTH